MCDSNKWMNIDTAPKDGTRVLVYVPPHGPSTAHNTFHLFGRDDRDYWHCHAMLNNEAQPTHWMWLPGPPEDA